MSAYLILAALAVLLAIIYSMRNFSYWRDQNVPFVPTLPIIGSIDWRTLFDQLHLKEYSWYQQYGRVYGRLDGSQPVLTVADPEILKKILVKDFHIFPNRRYLKLNDPIMDNTLFMLEGEEWKRVRSIVTPTLTTAKLKKMFPLINDCCDVLMENLSLLAEKSEIVNCQANFGAFVLSAIGRCAFGMSLKSLRDPNNVFIEKSRKLFHSAFQWRTILTMFFPSLMRIFRIRLLNSETMEAYRNLIVNVLEERKRLNVVQEDFLQMLLDAENNTEDSNNNATIPRSPSFSKQMYKRLTHDEMLSQCITFFLAGFESSTSLMSHIVYQLATNPHYQDRLVKEINDVLEKHDGVLDYTSIYEMKFMDAVMNECLRLCPSMVRSERRAEEDYYIEEKGIFIRKGILVSIPVYSIHYDPEFYPEPHKFKPERFYEPHPYRPQYVHLPFGAGPRVCVGMRFVQMQVKLCLAKILLKFQILPSPTLPTSVEIKESRNILTVNSIDVYLRERT